MAIVSISRIQQRRGQANSGTGLPQLASGELGWAIDTQELYIGNGSVSEGAPAVGNTRILTQNDINNPASIFGQLTYVYKSSGIINNYYILYGINYTDGIYVDVPLNWVSGGAEPIAVPIANITVIGGIVTSFVLVFYGIGSSIDAIFNDDGILGPGTGFELHVTSVSNSTGSAITQAVVRTMQSRLDDQVNTKDFGTVGDGVIDDSQFLQNAINQLFYNAPRTITTTITGSLTSGNNLVLCDATESMMGATVSGTDIPYGTTIVNVTVGVSFAMTSLATADGSQTLSLVLLPVQNVDYNTAERVVLEIPAGTYRVTNTIYVPSYATLIGAGSSSTTIYFDPNLAITGSIQASTNILNTISADNSMIGADITGDGLLTNTTVTEVNPGISLTLSSLAQSTQTLATFTLVLDSTTPVIQYINDTSTLSTPGNVAETTYINQPRYITLKNLQISTGLGSQVCLQLDSARNCLFENVKITGNWGEAFNENSIGINLTALSTLVTCQDNVFNNISINGFGYGVLSNSDISNNVFSNGYISDVKFGIALGITSDGVSIGQQYGPKTTKISKFNFNNVKHQAVYIVLGAYNSVVDSNLINVGNNGGASASPLSPQIYISSYNNIVKNINSDRPKLLSPPAVLAQYIPVVAGSVEFVPFGGYKITGLTHSKIPVSLFKLPLPTSIAGTPSGVINYKIDYIYKSTTNRFVRSGTLDITLNVTNYQVIGVTNYSNIQLIDEYSHTGLEDFNLAIAFNAKLTTLGGSVAALGTLPYNLIITYTNTLTFETGLTYGYTDAGSLTYSYSYNIL